MAKATIAALAQAKGIPANFLAKVATDDERGVVYSYKALDGSRARSHVRHKLESSQPSTWAKDGDKIVPFGSQLVGHYRSKAVPALTIAEGDTDTVTAWLHKIPAIGLPGASMHSLLTLAHVEGFPEALLALDSDTPGESAVSAVARHLRSIGYAGRIRRLSPAPHKDLNEMHLALNSNFDNEWARRVAEASEIIVSIEPPMTKQLHAVGLNLRDLRDVRFERVTWFESNMIPRTELTLANGDGGLGKTTSMLDLIARSSDGRVMPSGLRHERPMRWLIVAEEDRHGILRARLDVAGANHDNIRLVESVGEGREFLTLPAHAHALHEAIVQGGYDGVLIDALLNHLDDDVNASKPQEMRRALRPLTEVAHTTGATIIAIRHLSKGSGPASLRGLGSVEARNLCRSELTIGPHPDEEIHPGLFMVTLSKANLSPDRTATMGYRLVPTDVQDDDGLPTSIARVEWESAPPAITADALLDRTEVGEKSKIDAAVDWLRAYVGGREVRAFDACSDGRIAGHTQATLYRARTKAGVASVQRGFPGEAYWFLKSALDSQVSQYGKADNPGILENLGSGAAEPFGNEPAQGALLL